MIYRIWYKCQTWTYLWFAKMLTANIVAGRLCCNVNILMFCNYTIVCVYPARVSQSSTASGLHFCSSATWLLSTQIAKRHCSCNSQSAWCALLGTRAHNPLYAFLSFQTNCEKKHNPLTPQDHRTCN